MLSMTGFKPGQIVLVPFPFTDLSTQKQRPALVISSTHYNTTHSDVIVVAITSRLSGSPSEDEYQLSKTEQQAGGLPKPSKVKLGKIVTLDQRLIRRDLGQLLLADTRHILSGIKQLIGDN